MGRGCVAAFGNVAKEMASLDRRRVAKWREHRDSWRGLGEFPHGWCAAKIFVSRGRAAGVTGVLDSPRRARTGGMARRKSQREESRAEHRRTFSRRIAARNGVGDDRVRH